MATVEYWPKARSWKDAQLRGKLLANVMQDCLLIYLCPRVDPYYEYNARSSCIASARDIPVDVGGGAGRGQQFCGRSHSDTPLLHGQ